MTPVRGEEAVALLMDDPGIAETTDAEREALTELVSNRFWIVQNVLWGSDEAEFYGRVERDYAQGIVASVDSALSRLRGLPEEAVVYHAGPAPPEEGVMRGYVFGTVDSATAAAAARAEDLWEILVPRGTQVLLLSQVVVASTLTPFEVLLPRGSRFILISMAGVDSRGRLRLETA